MLSLCGNTDKAHPFFFERNFLDTVSILFCFLFVAEERMIQWKTKNLFYPFKGTSKAAHICSMKPPPNQRKLP